MSRPTVCWNAIVRNEARAIERCMASLVGQIDYWVVVDTGSDDGTPGVIEAYFRAHGIAGELHRRPWLNFGHNRNEALRLAEQKADYLLLMDADMTLEVTDPDWKAGLRADACLVRQCMPGLDQYLPRLVNARTEGDRRWRYRCATHEFLASEDPAATRAELFDGIRIRDYDDGGCKADKFARDARLLEVQLRELEGLDDADPDTADDPTRALLRDRPLLLRRTLFYLGESYRNGGLDLGQAIEYYRRRTGAGGWSEEIAWSWLQIGRCLEQSGAPWLEAQEAYLRAFNASPRRGEALMYLARRCNRDGAYALAYLYSAHAVSLPEPPADCLFLDQGAHGWGIPEEYALSCYWTGRHAEAARVWRGLLEGDRLPASERPRVAANLAYAEAAPAAGGLAG